MMFGKKKQPITEVKKEEAQVIEEMSSKTEEADAEEDIEDLDTEDEENAINQPEMTDRQLLEALALRIARIEYHLRLDF